MALQLLSGWSWEVSWGSFGGVWGGLGGVLGRLGARRGRYWREGSFLVVRGPLRQPILRARARGSRGGKAELL